MEYIFKINQLTIQKEIKAADESIIADEDALIEAIENIISNSIKYSDKNKTIII
ncbi:ATP-binding protein [Ignavibacterium sp.]|uniref:ATP-binding protein n=1 Tax=Ignavibacterium sp. TaxID=2651167 RepID=UPI00307E331A